MGRTVVSVIPRSWQNSQAVFAALVFWFTIFSKATSASKVIFYHNYLYTRICNFTGKNYREREELYWCKDGKEPHLTITLQLGLVTLSQTQGTLSSVSQYCYKVHVYKMFSDRLYKVTRKMPSIIFIQLTSVWEKKKGGMFMNCDEYGGAC